MDPLHQQMDLTGVPLLVDELLLHLVEIVERKILWWFRGWGQQGTFGGALIETLHAGGIDGLAHRLAAEAAEMAGLTVDLGAESFLFRGKGQAAVVTARSVGNPGHGAWTLMRLVILRESEPL